MKAREENSNYSNLAEEVQDSETKVKIVKVETDEAGAQFVIARRR